jgi:hypothetical protein
MTGMSASDSSETHSALVRVENTLARKSYNSPREPGVGGLSVRLRTFRRRSQRNADYGLVYLGEPFEGPYTLITRRSLAKVSVTALRLERWKPTHPWLVKRLGIP